jgi:type IV pilus assembly protein PilB
VSTLRKLGELLREAGLIDEAQLRAALSEQRKWGGWLGRTLVEMGFVTETSMCQVLARQLQLASIDLDTAQLPAHIESFLRLDLAERHGVFPVSFDGGLHQLALATSDPTNGEALQEIELATGYKVQPVVAPASCIDRAIRRHYFGEPPASRIVTPRLMAETSFELDQLLGDPAPAPAPAPRVDTEERLRAAVLALHEHLERIERSASAQSQAMKALVDLLVEYGLISREDLVQKLGALK